MTVTVRFMLITTTPEQSMFLLLTCNQTRWPIVFFFFFEGLTLLRGLLHQVHALHGLFTGKGFFYLRSRLIMGETLAPPKRAGRTTRKKNEMSREALDAMSRPGGGIDFTNRAPLERTQCRVWQNMPLSNAGTDCTWRGRVFGVGSRAIRADRR